MLFGDILNQKYKETFMNDVTQVEGRGLVIV